MAEALAVVGALAAVGQLSSSARKFSWALFQFARDAGAAAAEVERFAIQVQTFSDTIQTTRATLSYYCKNNPDSSLVLFMQTRNVLSNLDAEASTVRSHLVDIRDQVTDMRSRLTLWASIKWNLKKSSIMELSPEMESVKTSLCLLVATATLEAMIRSGNTKLKKEIRRLRRGIKHHLQTLQTLRQQLPHAQSVEGREPRESVQLQSALSELAWSLYDHLAVPDSLPDSPSGSSLGEREISPNRPGPNRPHPSRNTGASSGSSQRNRTSRAPSPAHQPELRRVSTRRRSSPSSRPNHPVAEHFQFEVPIEPRLFNKILRFKKEDADESISGLAGRGSGFMWLTTAPIVATLDGNIISIGKARDLNLDVEPVVAPNKGVVFDFGTGRHERSIGKAVLQWQAGSLEDPRYPPLTVTCDVCENSTVGLVFGRPFLEERARRWRRSGDAKLP